MAGQTFDLPDPGGRWRKIRDLPPVSELARPRSSRAARDFAADQSPTDRRPTRRRVAGDLDEIRTRTAELISRRDNVPFATAASRVPQGPEELRRLLVSLRARTNPDNRRENA